VRRVTALDFTCSTCGALIGHRCHKLERGGGPTAPHPARSRRAREEQQRLNPEHVAGQLGFFPAKEARA
jgi:hypothetical protein